MEPNNIEHGFKQKLKERIIQPSDKAWDRLDAMLSVAEQKPRRGFRWLYIAAAFLGFTLIGIFMLRQEKGTVGINTENQIVLENDLPVETENPEIRTVNPLQENKEWIFLVPKDENRSVKTKIVALSAEKTGALPEELKAEDYPVQVEIIRKEVKSKKYIEAEALLAQVENDSTIQAKASPQRAAVKVNPNSLLSNVEKEINENYRDRVIQSINKNYNAVKSSLANRNNE